jgi:hypothetical protein
MIHLGGTEVLQRPTHEDLIEPAQRPATLPSAAIGTLDAIIVPASRPAENLENAIALARETGAHLVVLCSLQTHASDVRNLLAAKEFMAATVVTTPEKFRYGGLGDFETTRWVHDGRGKEVCSIRTSDLSAKRNIGLLLARILGWERIFFMDDDIHSVAADDLLKTVSLLGTGNPKCRTSGMSVRAFPDNSVVCHARREVHKYQGVFVSGSVLAVDCTQQFGFFPDIYNEDWLFFYRDAAEELLATPGSLAKQLAYDPFADPQRAAAQEFGDVIAEGLYALLHSKLGLERADKTHWKKFLKDRKRILRTISSGLYAVPNDMRGKIGKAVYAADQMLAAITPDMCVDYVKAWQRDLERWEKLLANLPSASSIKEALHELELD